MGSAEILGFYENVCLAFQLKRTVLLIDTASGVVPYLGNTPRWILEPLIINIEGLPHKESIFGLHEQSQEVE